MSGEREGGGGDSERRLLEKARTTGWGGAVVGWGLGEVRGREIAREGGGGGLD